MVQQIYPSVASQLRVADEISEVPIIEGEILCRSGHSVLDDDDKLRDLKFWNKQVEGGTTVDYCCPACMDCAKCKNSDQTDNVLEDGTSVLVGSYELFPEVDSISTRVKSLHFGNSWRGRLAKDTEFFQENDDY